VWPGQPLDRLLKRWFDAPSTPRRCRDSILATAFQPAESLRFGTRGISRLARRQIGRRRLRDSPSRGRPTTFGINRNICGGWVPFRAGPRHGGSRRHIPRMTVLDLKTRRRVSFEARTPAEMPGPLDYQPKQFANCVGKTQSSHLPRSPEPGASPWEARPTSLNFGHRGARSQSRVLNRSRTKWKLLSHNHGFAVAQIRWNLNLLEIPSMNLNARPSKASGTGSHPGSRAYHPEPRPARTSPTICLTIFVKFHDQGS